MKKIDLSRCVLTGCCFSEDRVLRLKCDFTEVDLTDSVISGCDFSGTENLTLEQIKSTWNYKMDRMQSVVLPDELQKALDDEKKAAPVKPTN